MLGPLLALMVLALVAILLRALFAPDGAAPLPALGTPDGYGLLSAVAVVDDPETAAGIRCRLVAAGIRATVSTGRDGQVRVLVFQDELYRARRVVG